MEEVEDAVAALHRLGHVLCDSKGKKAQKVNVIRKLGDFQGHYHHSTTLINDKPGPCTHSTHHAVAHAEALVDGVDGGDDGLVLPVLPHVEDGAELGLQPVPKAARVCFGVEGVVIVRW